MKPAGVPSIEEVEQTLFRELQYVSIEIGGRSYGGWYRLLADGRMELLAQANIHNEPRSQGTPIEQARGMLAEFIEQQRRL